MAKFLFLAGACAALAITAGGTAANAAQRYAERPPIVLSPDLTAPWVTQLQGRQAVRRYERREARPRGHLPVTSEEQMSQIRRASPQQLAAIPRGEDPRQMHMAKRYLPRIVEYRTNRPAGTIVIDTSDKFLYLVLGHGMAKRYGVGVGRPGFGWAGTHRVSRKAEWPGWTPPKEMIAREAKNGHYLPAHMPGGPNNPLGARALYLGSTLYRIHGTNAPWTIGHNVSSGCIRMRNEDVLDLYDRVSVGTEVVVHRG
ncbi:L,D-transpeptidase [Pararhizobium mangrovi]|uniref:L,D-transpeptidase n=1 Tax=Pararhizobium mangrovi TaxID=2590452 RepID=A0A506TXL1_9HYPH|nr:L,D-transpeptidase [Pararhizobium mangrovi]TPW25908.1 L,D-transpeptidase [Pararhizobium mangrovi]